MSEIMSEAQPFIVAMDGISSYTGSRIEGSMSGHSKVFSFAVRYQDVEKHADLRTLAGALAGARLQVRDSLNLSFSIPERLAYRPGSRLFWMRRGWLRIDRVESGEVSLSCSLETVPAGRILSILVLLTGIALAAFVFLLTSRLGESLVTLAVFTAGSLASLAAHAGLKKRARERFKTLFRRHLYDLTQGSGNERGWRSGLKEIYSGVYPRK
jgi:hypothetical protein